MERRRAGAGVVNVSYDAKSFAQQLDATVQRALEELEALDPDRVIYADSGWTVKDIIGHVWTWDEEVLRALTAYRAGGEYHISNFSLHQFNHERREALKDRAATEIYSEWVAARERLKTLVLTMTGDELAGAMTYPSGRHGVADALVEEVIEHAETHLNDIRAVPHKSAQV